MAKKRNYDLVAWSGGGGIAFYVRSNEIRGVTDLEISTKTDTEDEESSSEKYTKKKNSGSYEIKFKAVLHAALGVRVQEVAMKMCEAARQGQSGYFYIAEEKMFPNSFMATEAKISDLVLTASGQWVSCEVEWTLKQDSTFDGSTSSGSSGTSGSGSGGSGKTTGEKGTDDNPEYGTGAGGGNAGDGEEEKEKAAGLVEEINSAKKKSDSSQNVNVNNTGSGGYGEGGYGYGANRKIITEKAAGRE